MPILTTDFASLTDDVQEIFNEVARTKVSENVGFQLFNVMDTSRKTYDYLALHGITGIQKVAQGADLPNITGVEGKNSIAFFKSLLINGENLKNAVKRFKATLSKQINYFIVQLQRLSEETAFLAEATVRTYVKA